VTGFQRFIKDFPTTSLTPNAHYWLGESFYGQKDYVRAMQAFEYVATEYPGNEKVPAALFKLGLSAAETGDSAKSRKYLKRVIEEYSTSDEAKLAKAKMAEIR
jgi:tol-pal system protein YbgF